MPASQASATGGSQGMSRRSSLSLRSEDVSVERTLGRRSSITLVGVVLGSIGLGSVAGLGVSTVSAQVTDRDSSDPAGRGRGCPGWSDSDPNDSAGCGHRTGLTDHDAADAPGRGRGRRTCSDADPSDPPGRGRLC